MKLKVFIERPVLSIVISVAIVLIGCISLFTLPIEQFPSIAPPTVEVTTSYPGANAETVQKSVIIPLEEAINGVRCHLQPLFGQRAVLYPQAMDGGRAAGLCRGSAGMDDEHDEDGVAPRRRHG